MSGRLVNTIKATFSEKTTEELQAILREHDDAQYSEAAFQAATEVLRDRGEDAPDPKDRPKASHCTAVWIADFKSPREMNEYMGSEGKQGQFRKVFRLPERLHQTVEFVLPPITIPRLLRSMPSSSVYATDAAEKAKSLGISKASTAIAVQWPSDSPPDMDIDSNAASNAPVAFLGVFSHEPGVHSEAAARGHYGVVTILVGIVLMVIRIVILTASLIGGVEQNDYAKDAAAIVLLAAWAAILLGTLLSFAAAAKTETRNWGILGLLLALPFWCYPAYVLCLRFVTW